jgi:hypothetical protein
MIRKTILGLVAASAIAAALAPTAASAHYYGGYGYRSYYAPSYSYGYSYNYYKPSYGYGYRSYYGGY